MKEEQKICLEAGMDIVAGKPVDFNELFEIMEKIVPWDRGRKQAVSKNRTAASALTTQRFKGIDVEKGLQIWQNEKMYKKALLDFSRDYGNAADEILNSVLTGDREGAYSLCHALKGVAGNLSVTEVYSIAAKLNAALRKKEAADLIPMIESLVTALDSAVVSVRQSAPEPGFSVPEDMQAPLRGLQNLENIFKELLDSFEKYNPAAAEPFLEKLSQSLFSHQTDPIKEKLDKFDFDSARDETVRLALTLGIDTE